MLKGITFVEVVAVSILPSIPASSKARAPGAPLSKM
jgi:hypothetical protein